MPFNKKLLGAAVTVFIAMAGGLYWQYSTIASQRLTLTNNAIEIKSLNNQITAKEEVAIKYKQERAKAQRERDVFKQRLEDAERANGCFNTPLSDDGKRVFRELYSGKTSR